MEKFKEGEIIRIVVQGVSHGYGKIIVKSKYIPAYHDMPVWHCFCVQYNLTVALVENEIKKLHTKKEKLEALTLRILGKL